MSSPNSGKMESRARKGSVSKHLQEIPNMELYKLLAETTIKNVPTIKSQHLIKFVASDVIKHVIQTLTKHELLSAPVYDPSKKEYIGMVDLRDFVDYIMSLHMKGESIINTADKMSDLSGTNPFIPIDEETPVIEALREFNIKRIHRMPITKHKDASDVVALLTESSLIEWLAKHIDVLAHFGSMTVKQLNLGGIEGFHQVICVKTYETLLAALSIIEKYKVHGLPVLDEHDKLVGNLSVSDLKYAADLSNLGITVHDFFEQNATPRPPLVTVTTAAKFSEVLLKMAEHKVHRIHVVDTENRPVDIISMSNVLDIILLFATGSRRR